MKKEKLLWLFAALFCMALISCGSDDDESTDDSNFYGMWKAAYTEGTFEIRVPDSDKELKREEREYNWDGYVTSSGTPDDYYGYLTNGENWDFKEYNVCVIDGYIPKRFKYEKQGDKITFFDDFCNPGHGYIDFDSFTDRKVICSVLRLTDRTLILEINESQSYNEIKINTHEIITFEKVES